MIDIELFNMDDEKSRHYRRLVIDGVSCMVWHTLSDSVSGNDAKKARKKEKDHFYILSCNVDVPLFHSRRCGDITVFCDPIMVTHN